MEQPAFFVDLTACSGCKTCMAACIDYHGVPVAYPWRKVLEYGGGNWYALAENAWKQDIFAYYVSLACNHCLQPACIEVCPTGAMQKGKNGIVFIDSEQCSGCRECERACPYGAPRFNPEDAKMGKCDFCRDRLEEGLNPVCVDACPMRAIHYGEYSDLERRFGPVAKSDHVAPLPDPAKTHPCLFIRQCHNAQPVDSTLGRILNPMEL